MRAFLTLATVAFSLFSASAQADHVNGYTRKNGTYVAPYERSHRDNTVTNNYSYQGNSNPYTGQTGTNHYQHDQTSPYFTGPDSHGKVGHGTFGGDGDDENEGE